MSEAAVTVTYTRQFASDSTDDLLRKSSCYITAPSRSRFTLTLKLTLVLFRQPQSRCLMRPRTQTLSDFDSDTLTMTARASPLLLSATRADHGLVSGQVSTLKDHNMEAPSPSQHLASATTFTWLSPRDGEGYHFHENKFTSWFRSFRVRGMRQCVGRNAFDIHWRQHSTVMMRVTVTVCLFRQSHSTYWYFQNCICNVIHMWHMYVCTWIPVYIYIYIYIYAPINIVLYAPRTLLKTYPKSMRSARK